MHVCKPPGCIRRCPATSVGGGRSTEKEARAGPQKKEGRQNEKEAEKRPSRRAPTHPPPQKNTSTDTALASDRAKKNRPTSDFKSSLPKIYR